MPAWDDAELPVVAAHRGLSAELPENSLPAFVAALEAGFPSLECDLRTTLDGEVVVLHDPGLERTTDGRGRVADITYDELRTYESGGHPVPRFDDLLRLSGDRLWNMETKVASAVAPALSLLQHHQAVGRALHMSFHLNQLKASQRILPELARAFLIAHPPRADDVRKAKSAGCGWLVGDERHWTESRVRKVLAAGMKVGSYTVNDPGRAADFVRWGVGCIITDRRDVLAAVQHAVRA